VRKKKLVTLWATGYAVCNHKGKILSNGIGQGIYTIYSKRPKSFKGLFKVYIYVKISPQKTRRGSGK